MNELADQLLSGDVEPHLIPTFNYSDPETVSFQDYAAWFKQYGTKAGNFTECDMEKEMQKVIKFVCLLWKVVFFFFFCICRG